MIKRASVLSLAAAMALAGFAETAPGARAGEALPAPRSLDEVRAGALAAMQAGQLDEVQKRRYRGGRGWRGGRSYRGNRGWRGRSGYRRGGGWRGGRYYRRDRGRGAAVAAGIAGLAVGAMIAGSAAENRRARRAGRSDARSWCAQRFRSYDWRSGTYTAYDGRQIACP